MMVLAIDTSTKACVLGVYNGEQTFVDETVLGRTHSEELLPRIDALLKKAGVNKAQLELIVYGQGPGSFTGLRIGIGVVQGLAFGLNIPVVGISTLACLARQAITTSRIESNAAMAVLAARNTEVYFGAYQSDGANVTLIGQEGVFEAAQIPQQDAALKWVGIGDGWQFAESLRQSSHVVVEELQTQVWPRAQDLLDLGLIAYQKGQYGTAMQALPEYLREKVAEKPKRPV